jgi:hypothetical protein
MDRVTYHAWIDQLTGWATSAPDVIGLVAVGSTSRTSDQPDEHSDHDLFVVTLDDAAAGRRADLSWLPHAKRIVMVHVRDHHDSS